MGLALLSLKRKQLLLHKWSVYFLRVTPALVSNREQIMKIFYVLGLAFLILSCTSTNEKSTKVENCWGYISNAVKFRSEGKYEDSLLEIEKHNVCDKSEIRMSYFYHKGWTLYEMKEYQRAVEAFTSGLETEPNYIYAYWRRGLAYEAMGEIQNAQESYRQGYELSLIHI